MVETCGLRLRVVVIFIVSSKNYSPWILRTPLYWRVDLPIHQHRKLQIHVEERQHKRVITSFLILCHELSWHGCRPQAKLSGWVNSQLLYVSCLQEHKDWKPKTMFSTLFVSKVTKDAPDPRNDVTGETSVNFDRWNRSVVFTKLDGGCGEGVCLMFLPSSSFDWSRDDKSRTSLAPIHYGYVHFRLSPSWL